LVVFQQSNWTNLLCSCWKIKKGWKTDENIVFGGEEICNWKTIKILRQRSEQKSQVLSCCGRQISVPNGMRSFLVQGSITLVEVAGKFWQVVKCHAGSEYLSILVS
jgi:hypothetical protein